MHIYILYIYYIYIYIYIYIYNIISNKQNFIQLITIASFSLKTVFDI